MSASEASLRVRLFFCSGMNVNDNLGKFAQKFSISCVTELDYICLREVDGRIMQVEMARN